VVVVVIVAGPAAGVAVDEAASPDPVPLLAPVGASPVLALVDRDPPAELAADRSFFAQPEPLKWTAGVVNPLRIEPSAPQLGQKRGPTSWIPWITSTMWAQTEQL
jgi:hypothetical protein